MIKRLDVWDFINEFKDYPSYAEHFSIEGLEALYDFFEEIDSNCELDVVAICCEFTEYESIEEFNEDYNEDVKTIEEVEELTNVIIIDNQRFIIQNY